MAPEGPGSIFDEAGKQSQKRALRKQQKAKTPKAPETPDAFPKTQGIPSDDDVKVMFKRMRDIKDDIQARMFEVYEKSGVPLKEIENFLENPKGVPERELARITGEMTQLENQVTDILGEKARKMASKIRAKKAGQKRKKKFLGKRQKWLEM